MPEKTIEIEDQKVVVPDENVQKANVVVPDENEQTGLVEEDVDMVKQSDHDENAEMVNL